MTRVDQKYISYCSHCQAHFMGDACPGCGSRSRKPRRGEDLRRQGLQRSEQTRRSIDWSIAALPPLLWHARFSVVFSARAHSKNASHLVLPGGKHKRVTTKINQAARAEIADSAKKLLQGLGVQVVRARLWVDILVQKTAWQADAGNVVDTVFDGLKLGIGLDDNFYCIRALDWELVKGEQALVIGLGQDTTVDQDFCMTCGALLPELAMRRVAGINRVCDGCCPPE